MHFGYKKKDPGLISSIARITEKKGVGTVCGGEISNTHYCIELRALGDKEAGLLSRKSK